jgi:hypothetical protein
MRRFPLRTGARPNNGPVARGGRVIVRIAAAAIALSACSGDGPPATGLPPVPSFPRQSAEADQPPVVWIGGTLTEVTATVIELREPFGSVVSLQRLGSEATGFFRVSGGTWERLPAGESVASGSEACVETLMDGPTLLALRVFLGVGCGPA